MKFVKLVTNPDYINLYEWEKFDYPLWHEWMDKNWILSVYFSIAYVILIFLGTWWMKDRQPYKLRGPLILWNAALSAFSFFGFIRTFPEILYLLSQPKDNFYLISCSRDIMNTGTAFWIFIIALSKPIELVDTLFIILKKKNLIFLHWYHHATVMMYTWYAGYQLDAGHRAFMTVNFLIHGIMYGWYFLAAMGIKLPKYVSVVITSMQMFQMVLGTAINIFELYTKNQNIECQAETLNIWIALAMYVSYFVLFANFFIKSYLQNSKRKRV